ncbi:MAG: ethanolamine ammonia-lyase reactivating factor EutA [Candidatus Heimdallarchaeota archaeon]|nr:ethanolamine ammonia-lyase reactivating factor EutA [Candidatus Heimdallarchaeota archaeon]
MSNYTSTLVFVCDACGHKQEPSYAMQIKIEEDTADASEFPYHCSQSMRLTIHEQKKVVVDKEIQINLEAAIWAVNQYILMYYTQSKADVEEAEKFERIFETIIVNMSVEANLEGISKLREAMKLTLNRMGISNKEKETIVSICKPVLDNMEISAKNRMNAKKRTVGPVMPGSDESYNIEYFCPECKENQMILEDEKKELLQSSTEDKELPSHHCGQKFEIRITQSGESNIVDRTSRKEHDPSNDFAYLMGENIEQMYVFSVGIDCGSSTTHLIFSKLKLQREVGFLNLTNRFNVKERKILYESEIINTPLKDKDTIDIPAVVSFIKSEYNKAGYNPENIDTGAVIVTGETAKKQNAKDIVSLLSEESGKFVSATAGPNFESLLAAMGSGAVARSKQMQNTILSVDIGGGTSNLAISSKGQVLSTACVNVGGRLLGIDNTNKIWRINQPSELLLNKLGMKYKEGDHMKEEEVLLITQKFAEVLLEVMQGPAKSELANELMMTDDLEFSTSIDEIIFCGGVAEYIYGETEARDDIGKRLGEIIKNYDFGIPVIEPENKIRATVIGAGSYSLSVSGSTCYVDPTITFPLENIPILVVNADKNNFSKEHIIEEIKKAYRRFDFQEGQDTVALYFKEPFYHNTRYLSEFAQAIETALTNSIKNTKLIILIFQNNMGSMVGITIRDETIIKQNLISLDELFLEDGDWIDIGAPLYAGEAFPVTVKSLAFYENQD